MTMKINTGSRLADRRLEKVIDEAGTELNLSQVGLKKIPKEISYIKGLQDLDVSQNEIESISISSLNYQTIRVIKAQGNRISTLPSGFSKLRKLHHLNIGSNRFEVFPFCLTKLRYLTYLNLDNNTINEIPEELALIRELRSLSLRQNHLGSLPSNFSNLRNLRALYLDGNRFTEFPKVICTIGGLEELRISNNQIMNVPSNFDQMDLIKTVSMSNNSFDEFPNVLAHLRSLEVLDLSNNIISSISNDLTEMISLKRLYMSSCKLQSIPESITHVQSLESLHLSDNKISIIPKVMKNLLELYSLDVSNNQLHELPAEISDLSSLRHFSFSGNNITEIPASIGSMRNLIDISAERNLISDLPIKMGELERLDWLEIDKTPFALRFPELISDDPSETAARIIAWLKGEINVPEMNIDSIKEEPTIRNNPPGFPSQGIGPHFELSGEGRITFVNSSSIDQQGNNISRLKQLLPLIQEITNEILQMFGERNNAHQHLASRAQSYADVINKRLEDVDFSMVYVAGLRLTNAASLDIADDETPALPIRIREALESLLQLHGVFVLSTAEGIAQIQAEERYNRSPREEEAYRAAALEFTKALESSPEIIEANAAQFITGTVGEIFEGSNVERSGSVATGVLKNVAVAISAAATVGLITAGVSSVGSPALAVGASAGALPIIEGLKKSKPFIAIANIVTSTLNSVAESSLETDLEFLSARLQPFTRFMITSNSQIRRLSESKNQLRWLDRVLVWLEQADEPQNDM